MESINYVYDHVEYQSDVDSYKVDDVLSAPKFESALLTYPLDLLTDYSSFIGIFYSNRCQILAVVRAFHPLIIDCINLYNQLISSMPTLCVCKLPKSIPIKCRDMYYGGDSLLRFVSVNYEIVFDKDEGKAIVILGKYTTEERSFKLNLVVTNERFNYNTFINSIEDFMEIVHERLVCFPRMPIHKKAN